MPRRPPYRRNPRGIVFRAVSGGGKAKGRVTPGTANCQTTSVQGRDLSTPPLLTPPLHLGQCRSRHLLGCPPWLFRALFLPSGRDPAPRACHGRERGPRWVAQEAIANPIQIWSRTRPFFGHEPLHGGNQHMQVRRVCGEGAQCLELPVPVGSEGESSSNGGQTAAVTLPGRGSENRRTPSWRRENGR